MKRIPLDPAKIVLLGTYGNVTFYIWRGLYCARSKSSLTRKRVKRSAAFRITMEYAEKLGRASKIASQVYRQLPDGWKLHNLYRKMTGLGSQLLKQREQSAGEIEMALWKYLESLGYKEEFACKEAEMQRKDQEKGQGLRDRGQRMPCADKSVQEVRKPANGKIRKSRAANNRRHRLLFSAQKRKSNGYLPPKITGITNKYSLPARAAP